MPHSDNSNQRFEGAIAGQSYEAVLEAICPHYAPLMSEMVALGRQAARGEKATICDLGCGTGTSTRMLLSVNPDARIIAIDNSRKMLDAVPADIRDHPRITWVHGDIVEVLSDLQDGSIDVAANGFAIHNLLPETRAVLYSVVAKKLKTSGAFVSADKIAVNDEREHLAMLAARKEEYRTFAAFGYPEAAAEWVEHYEWDDLRRLSEQEFAAGLKAVGLFAEFGKRMGMYVTASAAKRF